jgi:hypothetical protein
MDAILKSIFDNWAIFVAIGGAWGVVYATIKVKVPNIENRLEEIEKMDLVTKDSCAAMQHNCQKMICAKIDVLKSDIEMMNQQRQDARNELFNELKSISRFMGRVEQYMADHIKAP